SPSLYFTESAAASADSSINAQDRVNLYWERSSRGGTVGGASSEDSGLGSLDISRGWMNFLKPTSLGTVFALLAVLTSCHVLSDWLYICEALQPCYEC